MNDGIYFVGTEYGFDVFGLTQVALDEFDTLGDKFAVARRKIIENNGRVIGVQQRVNHVTADIPRPADD